MIHLVNMVILPNFHRRLSCDGQIMLDKVRLSKRLRPIEHGNLQKHAMAMFTGKYEILNN